MIQRAAGYVRVSDESQVEGHSLDAQRREITRYCERHGLSVPAFYADEGVSAHTEQLAKRPALSQLLADARAGRFDVVIVHTIDRWARNVSVQRQALQQLGHAGVGFVSVTENFDFTTPAGRLMLTMIGGVSEFFSDQLAVHVAKGQRERAQQGLPVGPVPFGYVPTDPGSPARLVPDEAEAVREAFERRVRGDSNGRIARWLNEQGHRPRGKNALFTSWAVRDMLSCRFYVGRVSYRDEEFDGQHSAIIDDSLFARAQAMRGHAPERRPATGATGALRGRARCSRCGSRLHAERNFANRPRYRERHGIACTSNGQSVVAEVIDGQIGLLWSTLRLPEDWRSRIAHAAVEEDSARTRGTLEARRRRVITAFVDGALDEAEYRRLLGQLDADLAGVMPADGPRYEDAAALLADLPRMWDLASGEERQRLLAPLVEAVHVNVSERRVEGFSATAAFDGLLEAMPSRSNGVLHVERAFIGGMVETGEN